MQKNNPKTSDLFKLLSTEAESYRSLDQINSLVENNQDLAPLPVQPLYLAIKSLPADEVASYLPRLSKDQRIAFLDIDLWKRDELDVEQFHYWIQAYTETSNEEVKLEFVKSDQFAIFLKGKFNIWTFDAEEPEYPEHDNYFLTDDGLLLFEYDEHYSHVQELKDLIRLLYSEMGVENAYTYLFKIVSDGFLSLQEEEYRLKTERLRDIGFVDYFDALEFDSAFVHLDQLHGFIKRKASSKFEVGELFANQMNQTLHLSSLIPFRDHFNSVVEELAKLNDQKRIDFLQFNFVRLLNGVIELNSALKKGSMAMNRSGAQVKNILTLAVSYLNAMPVRSVHFQVDEKESIFLKFDFIELYRIGNSLIKIPRKELKKVLAKYQFEESKESFLGTYWEEFLDLSFEEETKFIPNNSKDSKALPLLNFEEYEEWRYKMKSLEELIPFMAKFYETLERFKEEGMIHDSYYLNYKVDDINFEALVLSSFANFLLGTYAEESTSKLGLTIDEFKSFATKVITSDGRFILTPELYQKIKNFTEKFGLANVTGFHNYFQKILQDQLEGYEYETLAFEDFMHVGGPIILNRHKH